MRWMAKAALAVLLAACGPAAVTRGQASAAVAPQAGYVKGRVTDEDGKPLAGVTVEVVYQTFNADKLLTYGKSIKRETQSGPDGTYSLMIGNMPPGLYSAHAYQVVRNGSNTQNVDLTADNNDTFGQNAATVRNFKAGMVESSEELPYGNGGVFVLNNDIMDFSDLDGAEVTLVNTATGKTIVKKAKRTGEGPAVTGIPFGTYRASVKLNGRPMQIRLWGPGQPETYGPSVTHDFTMGDMGDQIQVMVKP